ncbi:hypothetical protein U0070_008563 [Myodes glareolus]|uniref:Uncharacterized protein n=1 Tax=Myodes glareolus TaxID=447135 RepID=A0AAW0HN36_MYOGA
MNIYDALELHDIDKMCYYIKRLNAIEQEKMDKLIIQMDGTENKLNLVQIPYWKCP